jgi:hypothetical protein
MKNGRLKRKLVIEGAKCAIHEDYLGFWVLLADSNIALSRNVESESTPQFHKNKARKGERALGWLPDRIESG